MDDQRLRDQCPTRRRPLRDDGGRAGCRRARAGPRPARAAGDNPRAQPPAALGRGRGSHSCVSDKHPRHPRNALQQRSPDRRRSGVRRSPAGGVDAEPVVAERPRTRHRVQVVAVVVVDRRSAECLPDTQPAPRGSRSARADAAAGRSAADGRRSTDHPSGASGAHCGMGRHLGECPDRSKCSDRSVLSSRSCGSEGPAPTDQGYPGAGPPAPAHRQHLRTGAAGEDGSAGVAIGSALGLHHR